MVAEPPPDPRRLSPFTVGDWLAEPKACRLSRGEAAVKLRPQLMDLLVCLSRRAGDIVLKEEIQAEVWASQYMAESGLSRCVAELRQAMADDARTPRIIETIPKRGYRLVASVGRDEPARAPAAPPAAAMPVPRPAERERFPYRPLEAAVLALGVFLREHVRLMVR